jgi:hypothetical protein
MKSASTRIIKTARGQQVYFNGILKATRVLSMIAISANPVNKEINQMLLPSGSFFTNLNNNQVSGNPAANNMKTAVMSMRSEINICTLLYKRLLKWRLR